MIPQKKRENKKIEIKVIENHTLLTSVEIVIVNQSHTEESFGINGNSFVASDGFTLQSCACPATSGSNKLFVRGWDVNMDDSSIVVKRSYFIRLQQAIKEYNEYFTSAPRFKPDMDDELFEI